MMFSLKLTIEPAAPPQFPTVVQVAVTVSIAIAATTMRPIPALNGSPEDRF